MLNSTTLSLARSFQSTHRILHIRRVNLSYHSEWNSIKHSECFKIITNQKYFSNRRWISSSVFNAAETNADSKSYIIEENAEKKEGCKVSVQESNWNRMCEKLSHYYKKHKSSKVSVDDPTLAKWVQLQRYQYKHNELSKSRINNLLDLEFQFERPKDQAWESMRRKLQIYKEKEGHMNVPIQNYALFIWVKVQRREYKKYLKKESTGMTDKRIQSLKKMGFIFDSLEHSWQKMFQQLKEYVEKHGDGNVPTGYKENPILAIWVRTQRKNYKLWNENPQTIDFPKHRRDALNDLGFVWDMYDAVWNEQYLELEKFKAAHGHCLVPNTYDQNPSLGSWVATQRRQYVGSKPSGLNPERIKKLEALDFVWNVWDARWKERFEELVDFIDMNGHSDVTHANKILRSWVQVQRYQYYLWKKGEKSGLTQERREMLDKIGFDWMKKKSY